MPGDSGASPARVFLWAACVAAAVFWLGGIARAPAEGRADRPSDAAAAGSLRAAVEPIVGEWEPVDDQGPRLVLTIEGVNLAWAYVYYDGSGEVWMTTVLSSQDSDGTVRMRSRSGPQEYTLRLDGGVLVIDGIRRYVRVPGLGPP